MWKVQGNRKTYCLLDFGIDGMVILKMILNQLNGASEWFVLLRIRHFPQYVYHLDFFNCNLYLRSAGHAVVQLVEALRYKPEGRGFDSRWYHWNFSLT
jgi:hypothetical protein